MFSLNSKFYAYCNTFAKLVGLNAWIIVGSLPIVTAGAAITSGIRGLNHSEGYLLRTLFTCFKQSLLKSIPIVFFNFASLSFALTVNVSGRGIVVMGLYYLFLVFLLTYNVNCYVILERYKDLNTYHTFKMAFVLNVITFAKTVWLPLLWVLLVLYTYTWLGVFLNVMLITLPLSLHLRMVRKELTMMDEFIPRKTPGP